MSGLIVRLVVNLAADKAAITNCRQQAYRLEIQKEFEENNKVPTEEEKAAILKRDFDDGKNPEATHYVVEQTCTSTGKVEMVGACRVHKMTKQEIAAIYKIPISDDAANVSAVCGSLTRMTVLPKMQGQGVGRAMMAFMDKHAKEHLKIEEVYLNAVQRNIGFYYKCDYKPVPGAPPIREKYADTTVMFKTL